MSAPDPVGTWHLEEQARRRALAQALEQLPAAQQASRQAGHRGPARAHEETIWAGVHASLRHYQAHLEHPQDQ